MTTHGGIHPAADVDPAQALLQRIVDGVVGLYAVLVPLTLLLSRPCNGWLPPINALDQLLPLLLPLAPLLLLIALARRLRREAWLLAATSAALCWLQGPLWLRDAPADRTPPDLVIVSWDLAGLRPDVDPIAELAATDADVIALQGAAEAVLNRCDDALAARYPHRRALTRDGVAILSRFPIASSSRLSLASQTGHLQAVIQVAGRSLRVVSAQLDPWTALLGRCIQGTGDLQHFAGFAGASLPTVLAGDLRTSDHSAAYRSLMAHGFRDAFVAAGTRGLGLTCAPSIGTLRGPLALFRFDYLLCTAQLKPLAAAVLPVPGAPHRPLRAGFAWK